MSEDGETKHLFREAMRDIVPDAIRCRRDKIGFQTPESGWLRRIGPRVEEWLAGPCEIPFLRTDRIQAAVGEMVAGRRGWTPMAWRFVNFIRWMQLFDVGSAAPRFRAGLHCEAA